MGMHGPEAETLLLGFTKYDSNKTKNIFGKFLLAFTQPRFNDFPYFSDFFEIGLFLKSRDFLE